MIDYERERPGHDSDGGGGGEGPAAGKRALTDRLPRGGGAPSDAAAAGGGGGGAGHEDPFWFADGPRANDGGGGNIDQATMQSLYYGINPPRHAEKAYQRE